MLQVFSDSYWTVEQPKKMFKWPYFRIGLHSPAFSLTLKNSEWCLDVGVWVWVCGCGCGCDSEEAGSKKLTFKGSDKKLMQWLSDRFSYTADKQYVLANIWL